jgi:hypothetical protein
MIIPSKHSGYQAGIRLYPMGGGGGSSAPEAPPPPPPPPNRMASAAPPPAFTTYGQGDRTGSMVQSGNSFRPSTLDYSRPIYDPNYADNITGYQQSSQFYQPIFQPQYNNYANPLTAGNVANYGTNPGPSSGYLAATAQGGQGLNNYYQSLRNFGAQQSSQPYGMDYTTFNPARKALGANQADLQQAYEYNPQQQFGGFSGQQSMPQMQTPFNPYTNQYQSPFSYQQPMQQMQQMQTPFSYQQPQQQEQQRQMQQQMQQQVQKNYGPSQAIVGRSSQMRGTPNVMRRAEGGITSLMDDVE